MRLHLIIFLLAPGEACSGLSTTSEQTLALSVDPNGPKWAGFQFAYHQCSHQRDQNTINKEKLTFTTYNINKSENR